MKRLRLSFVSMLLSLLIFTSTVFADETTTNDVESDVETVSTAIYEDEDIEVISDSFDTFNGVVLLTGNEDVTPTPEVTPEITENPSDVTPTPTDDPEITEEPITTPEITPTDSPDVTPEPTDDVTPTPEVSPEVTPETTPTLEPTNTPVITEPPVVTIKPTATPTPTAIPVVTIKPTAVPTEKPTEEPTNIPSVTPTTTPEATDKPSTTPTVKPTTTPTTTPGAVNQKKLIRSFVERLYSECLDRTSDKDGLDYWTDELLNGTQTGADVASFFVLCDEYIEKGDSTEEFLTVLYYTFFNREPDEDGIKYWTSVLEDTLHTREYVLSGFVNSPEFASICDDYGIVRGSYASPHAVDVSLDVSEFVRRLYTLVLDRDYDLDGLDYWANELNSFNMSTYEVARSFFYSKEFINKNTSNSEFVELLYATCMNRESDKTGYDFWVKSLKDKSKTRDDVLEFFLTCEEFRKIMADSGIVEHPIVTIARREMGYSGGLKYCRWYGYNFRIEWCACFVSWCADQGGYIASQTIPRYKWCLDAKDWFTARNQWVSDCNYTPKSGDIIFFDWNGNGVIDHTGIVVGVEPNGRIHTIEGNKEDVVKNDRVLFVGDKDICGYGVPAYK